MEEQVVKLREMIDASRKIVFFGGAGVSTESNIPDFRSGDGLFHRDYLYSPEEVVSHSFFMNHPGVFYDFYKSNMMILNARPNAAHLKLAELERKRKLSAVITQNIDGLHQAAGSQKVYELHGSIHRNYCMKCHQFYDAKYVKHSEGIPKCRCGGMLKPDVVLYEENLNETVISGAIHELRHADMLLIGGTSLMVYPAAGFIDHFRGDRLVVINKTTTAKEVGADLCITAPIGKVLESL